MTDEPLLNNGYKMTELGPLPEDWKVVRLGDTVDELKNGFASGKRDENGIVQIRMNNVTTNGRLIFDCYLKVPIPENIDHWLLKKGDFLFNNTNSIDLVGKSTIFNDAPFPCTFSNHFTRIRFKKESVLPELILYRFIILWERGYFKSVAIRHVGQSAVHNDYLLKIKIPLPPLPEQRRIAEILTTIDSAIQRVSDTIEKTERLKEGLMQRLLTQGIGHERFKETEVGRVPEGWEVSELGETYTIIDCKHKTPKYTTTGHPVVRPRDLKPGKLNLQGCLKTSYEEFLDLTEKYLPKRGDIVYCRSTSFGVASYVATDEKFSIGQDIVIITSNQNSTEFLFYLLYSSIIELQIQRLSTGSTFKRIDLKKIKKLRIPLPPLAEQRRIAEILSTVDEKLELEHERKEKLERIKKGLMNDLLIGRKRVRIET